MQLIEIAGILESPMIIGGQDFNFNDVEYNKQKAKDIVSNENKHVIYKSNNITVYEIANEIVGISTKEDLIDYYVQYEKFRDGFVQVKLWRSSLSPETGLAGKIFFDYLLSKFGTIISDDIQTKEGEFFWRTRIAEAISKNHKVGMLHNSSGTVTWFNGKETLREWLDRMDGWGEDDEYIEKLFVISS